MTFVNGNFDFNLNIESGIFEDQDQSDPIRSYFINEEDKILKTGDKEFDFFKDKKLVKDQEEDVSFNKVYDVISNDKIDDDKKYMKKIIFKKKQKKEINKLRKKRSSNKVVKENIIKRHTSSDNDNVLRKIQVQFISFIIFFSNDVVSFLLNDYENTPYFHNVEYELKKKVNHKNVESLKKKTIEEIIRFFKITPKIKKKKENENEKSLNALLKKNNNSIVEYFKTKYLDLFKKYFNNNNDNFEVNGQNIPLSDKTKKKTFSSLLKKNERLKEKIKYVCINYYINSYKKIKKPVFHTSTSK